MIDKSYLMVKYYDGQWPEIRGIPMNAVDEIYCGIIGGCILFVVFLLVWEPSRRTYQKLRVTYLNWKRSAH